MSAEANFISSDWRRSSRPLVRSDCAFTLVELMISIALAVVLMLGINAVFKVTTDTVGTGFAISNITREQRGVERVFKGDFDSAVPAGEQPFIVIQNETQPAFRDVNDLNADADGNMLTVDLDNSGVEGDAVGESVGGLVGASNYGRRMHRIDRLGFFARNVSSPFTRQTGNGQPGPMPPQNAELVSAGKSREAFIWYGHLKLPDNTAAPNPYHATLGMTNAEVTADSSCGVAPTSPPGAGRYYNPGQHDANLAFSAALNPNNLFVNGWRLGRVAVLLVPYPLTTDDYITTTTETGSPLGPLARMSRSMLKHPVTVFPWNIEHSRFDVAQTTIAQFRELVRTAAVGWDTEFNYRFNCRPWANRNAGSVALTSNELALTVPFLQKGVGQFMVEFAGDFCSQAANGAFGTPGADGITDFVVENGARRMRWYGLPRDVGGGPNGEPDGVIDTTASRVDVVPLMTFAGSATPVMTFEKPTRVGTSVGPGAQIGVGTDNKSAYTCAWRNAELVAGLGPRFIRIVIQINDPTGRLPDGQMYEFVYAMPQ